MRDVAAQARVSFKTVSRVVNGEAGVSPALTERVRRAIEELDFRPNASASSLRRSDHRTSSVGLLLQDVANPFSAVLQRVVEDAAIARGFIVFSASLDEDPARERALTREFSARRADGLVLVPAGDDQSYLASEVRAGTAVVCVDREAQHLAVDSVITTNTTGSAEGVRHLAASGHRRIAYLGDRRTIVTARQRHQGYVDALHKLGVPPDPSLVVHDLGDATIADGAAMSLLSRPDPPTALFTAQNLVTIGTIRALRRLGLERTVAVVGFDDFPMADLLSPGVTVVAQDPTAIGRTAATLLFNRIAGDTSPPATHVVPTTLIRRGSGEIPPPE
jgi:LacI family transcriptional regulator